VLGLVAVVAAAVAGLDVYTRLPVGDRTPALDLPPAPSTVVLVIHGAGDADNPLMPLIVERLEGAFAGRPGTVVRYLRWDPESDERLRAAATARAVGQRVGAGLAATGSVRELHLIAHSVGAFMPDAICHASRWCCSTRSRSAASSTGAGAPATTASARTSRWPS
jgi:hypothetical protein